MQAWSGGRLRVIPTSAPCSDASTSAGTVGATCPGLGPYRARAACDWHLTGLLENTAWTTFGSETWPDLFSVPFAVSRTTIMRFATVFAIFEEQLHWTTSLGQVVPPLPGKQAHSNNSNQESRRARLRPRYERSTPRLRR
jgi:hypothetical protein